MLEKWVYIWVWTPPKFKVHSYPPNLEHHSHNTHTNKHNDKKLMTFRVCKPKAGHHDSSPLPITTNQPAAFPQDCPSREKSEGSALPDYSQSQAPADSLPVIFCSHTIYCSTIFNTILKHDIEEDNLVTQTKRSAHLTHLPHHCHPESTKP